MSLFKKAKLIIKKIYWWLFLRMKDSYLSLDFQLWLFGIITRDHVDFQQIQSPDFFSILPKNWEVKGLNKRYGILPILGYRLGYLVIPDEDENNFILSLKHWISSTLNSCCTTQSGVASLCLLSYQLGFLTLEEQQNLIEYIKNDNKVFSWEEIVLAYCKSLNNADVELSAVLSNPYEWEKLERQIDVSADSCEPVSILSYMLFESSISRVSILLLLKPKLRCAAIQCSILPNDSFEKGIIISSLSNNPAESAFVFYTILSYHNSTPSWLDNECFDFLINTYWKDNIGYLIRRVFNRKALSWSNNAIISLREKISSFIILNYNSKEFCDTLKWPDDWESLAIWLESNIDEILSNQDDEFCINAFNSFIGHIGQVVDNIYSFYNDSTCVVVLSTNEIGKGSIKVLFTKMLLGFLQLNLDGKDKALWTLKKSLHQLKEMLYGNISAKNLSLEIIDIIIYFYLCSSYLEKLNSDALTRLRELSDVVEKTLLFVYVKEREVAHIFWDKNYQPTQFYDITLYHVNNIMHTTNLLVTEFKDKVNLLSNSHWGKK